MSTSERGAIDITGHDQEAQNGDVTGMDAVRESQSDIPHVYMF